MGFIGRKDVFVYRFFCSVLNKLVQRIMFTVVAVAKLCGVSVRYCKYVSHQNNGMTMTACWACMVIVGCKHILK